MNVATSAKQHPMANIAESGAAPMAKVVSLRTGNPDQASGLIWAQTAIALCMGQASAWAKMAHELFTMNIEQREAAIKAWRQWKSDKTKAFKAGEETSPKMDEKDFKRIMGTATVRLCHMSKIAAAITAGMDVEAVAHHYHIKVDHVPGLSVDSLYALAALFAGSKAGRAPDSFIVKLGKFLDGATKAGVAEADVATFNKVVEFVNGLQG